MSHIHVTRRYPPAGDSSIKAFLQRGSLQLFDDLPAFSQAVEAETGIVFDFESVINLQSNFLERSAQHLILNVKEENGNPDNLLFLTEQKAFLFSREPPEADAFEPFRALLARPYGLSTVLTFLTLHKVLDSYRAKFETIISQAREMEQSFDPQQHRELSLELERLDDRLEEFSDLLLKLQERGIKQVDAEFISFDYSVLTAEGESLGGRIRRRLDALREMARNRELQMSTQLNLRIEKLTDVMKKLTAITVILMIPTLIASHFGMNFRDMPELKFAWAYPAVILFQVVLVGLGIIIFRKIDWL
ncbi:MAG: magnesium transporter CorA family protein [Chloroflexi bacterium]|nr:magnesium transporter CorA family protein [Chloroflexota bacterium]